MKNDIKKNSIVKGRITGVTKYGVFVDLGNGYTGLIHISQIANKYIRDIFSMFEVDDIISAKVISIDEESKKVDLSIKKIDFKVEKDASSLLEKGKGFIPLKNALDMWIKEKIDEINNQK